jgi:hypothetical protein
VNDDVVVFSYIDVQLAQQAAEFENQHGYEGPRSRSASQ